MRRLLAAAAVLAALLIVPVAASTPAQAATGLPRATLGDRVLNTAETRAGHWYSYGAAGPSYFDCSGLVAWAASRHGVSVPHSTYGMLYGSRHLYRISLSQARRGDLLFFGSGHVEFATIWRGTSFGAHHAGTRVGWARWSGSYRPTAAMRLR